MKRTYQVKGGIYQYLCHNLMEATRQTCDYVFESMNEETNDPSLFMKNVMTNLKNWEGFVKKFTKPRERGAYTFEDYDLEAFASLVRVAVENLIENETVETMKPYADVNKTPTKDFIFIFLNFARLVFIEYQYEIKDTFPDEIKYWDDKICAINAKIEILYKE